MEKYVFVKTGEEIKIGDLIQYENERDISFGKVTEIIQFVLTPEKLKSLIEKGIVKKVGITLAEDDITPYIKIAAARMRCSEEELITWMDRMNKICPKAVFDFLLQTIAFKMYKDAPFEFNKRNQYYSLRPKDGKVGKVSVLSSYIPLFKSAEDAEKARRILKKQLDFMYGGKS